MPTISIKVHLSGTHLYIHGHIYIRLCEHGEGCRQTQTRPVPPITLGGTQGELHTCRNTHVNGDYCRREGTTRRTSSSYRTRKTHPSLPFCYTPHRNGAESLSCSKPALFSSKGKKEIYFIHLIHFSWVSNHILDC